MDEPKPAKEEINISKELGHDNRTFTTADETALPTITSLVNGKNRPRTMENSRL